MVNEILIVTEKKEQKFLRKKAAEFDFKKFTKKEINELLARMRRIMHEANGIGLSANQIGLDLRMFVAEVPDHEGNPKFYAVFNPKIEKTGDKETIYEEGCLSVPGKWGDVKRPEKIVLIGTDRQGKPARIKAWGLLARVFQHEMDHLNGKLFIDRTKAIRTSGVRPGPGVHEAARK
jgi:peptide deformylase